MQANLMATNDGVQGVIIEGDTVESNDKFYQSYIAPYYKIDKYCPNTEGCLHKYGIVKNLNKVLPTDLDYKQIGETGNMGPRGISFIFMSGNAIGAVDDWYFGNMSAKFGINSNGERGVAFYFDVNDLKNPNVFGKDIYILTYSPSIGFLPAGFHKTDEEIKNNCENGNGYFCLAYVLKNHFKIDNKTWNR